LIDEDVCDGGGGMEGEDVYRNKASASLTLRIVL